MMGRGHIRTVPGTPGRAHGVDVLFELDHVSFGGEKREIGGRELRPSENGTVLHLL